MNSPTFHQVIDPNEVSAKEIGHLIRDLELRQDNALITYVTDPYEVFDFCFPVDLADPGPVDINSIADDHVALYEYFFLMPWKPVLPLEYVQEAESILRHFESEINAAYGRLEMVDFLIRTSDLQDPDDLRAATKMRPEGLQRILQENFNQLLAVVMGLYSLGVELLSRTLSQRVQKDFRVESSPEGRRIFKEYSRTPLYAEVLNVLVKEIKDRTRDAGERRRAERHAKYDASVIDRVVYLNAAFHQAWSTGAVKKRRIFLYVSSAPRSARVFRLRSLNRAMVRLGLGEDYSILRTRKQLFAYVVHRSNEVGPTGDERTLIQLRDVQRVLLDVNRSAEVFQRPGEACKTCVLGGGSGETEKCRWYELCGGLNRIREAIERKREAAHNLSLVVGLENYKHLFERKEKSDYSRYADLLQEVYARQEIGDWAIARRRDLLFIISLKSEFAGLLPLAIQVSQQEAFLRDRDVVTAASQYLPRRAKIHSPDYQEIWNLVDEYYETPASGGEGREQLIQSAVERFTAREATYSEFDGDHEIVRCLLYLAFYDKEGDRKAFRRALQMADRDPGVKREFIYIACWAGRRARVFSHVDDIATTAIMQWPNDPRYYHGKALNTFSWVSDPEQSVYCPNSIEACIDDTQCAIKLYRSEPIDSGMLGANYNNLAYFLTFDRSSTAYNVRAARAALENLKACVSKVTWDPLYPEYFHTEAHVEYEEFLEDFPSAADRETRERLQHKLESAARDIARAMDLFPGKQLYRELQKKIELARSRVR